MAYIKNALIGYTGFVGSNLITQFKFDKLYNSKNISEIDGNNIDLLVCAGVRATKWLANQKPEIDFDGIQYLQKYLARASINYLVLISTIDVYDSPISVNEDSLPNLEKQDHYGRNRFGLEQWVRNTRSKNSYSIIRLPALFGPNLKKNLIFDLLNPLANTINKPLWHNLKRMFTIDEIRVIEDFYIYNEHGNLELKSAIQENDKQYLINVFKKSGFSTLNFTDSRSEFQFYNLNQLWSDISIVLDNRYPVFNLACEPISAKELVEYISGKPFINNTDRGPAKYDMYSKYAKDRKYFYNKHDTLEQIKHFVEAQKCN